MLVKGATGEGELSELHGKEHLKTGIWLVYKLDQVWKKEYFSKIAYKTE